MCVRTAEYPHTVAPVRLLRTAGAPRSAPLRRVLRVREVPYRRTASVRGTHIAQGYCWVPLVDARAACGMQATGQFGYGGLVNIQGDNNHVSVVGSTLTNINVRSQC